MAQGSVTRLIGPGLGLTLGLVLAACSTPPPKPPPPTVVAPPPAAKPAPPPPSPAPRPVASADPCGAAPLQWLVGKPRTEIPVPVEPNHRRVVCSGCEVTPETVPFRQTIVYDLHTGLVTQVKCG